MELNQIATLLNNTLVPNVLGVNATPVAADLSNLIDLGTAISNLSAQQAMDFSQTFIAGVAENYFDTRRYEAVAPDIYMTSEEFGGALQRIKAPLTSATISNIYSLTDGASYDDHVFHGITLDNKVYTKDTIFEVVHSIPWQKYKKSFTSAEGVQGVIAMIESVVDRTLTVELHSLTMSLLTGLGASAKDDSREIALVTLYNSDTGNTLTATTALHDYDFLQWAAAKVLLLRDYVRDMNKKYNDATVETFTPLDDIRVTLLSLFDNALKTRVYANTWHDELVRVPRGYNTVNSWIGSGSALLPDLATVGKLSGQLVSGTTITATNVVGMIYDKYAAGITTTPLPVRSAYTASGDFTNYWTDREAKYYVDTRETAIILTLN